MPQAGDTIRALDFTEPVKARDATTATGLGVGTSTYEADPGSLNPVGVTFVAPTSGRVQVHVWAGLAVSASIGRAQADFEVREDDAAGAVVWAQNQGGANPLIGTESNTAGFGYRDGSELVTGLTPGGTYYAQVLTRATTGATEYDVSDRMIHVYPVP
jgi:hypothetical protein